MNPCNYDLFAKVEESLPGTWYNTRDGFIRVIGICGAPTKMDVLMVYDAFQTFGKR